MATSTEVSFGLKILISKILQTLVKVDSIWLISYFRSIIVFASVVSGGFFLHDNTSEFLKSTVQTTLDSMVPLSQVSPKSAPPVLSNTFKITTSSNKLTLKILNPNLA